MDNTEMITIIINALREAKGEGPMTPEEEFNEADDKFLRGWFKRLKEKIVVDLGFIKMLGEGNTEVKKDFIKNYKLYLNEKIALLDDLLTRLE